TVHFAGDAADLPNNGFAALDVLPATDVTQQVRIEKDVSEPKNGVSRVNLTITNKHSPTLTGLFAIQLNDLTPGVTLQSATMAVNGVTYNLTITYNAVGAPIINIPAAAATSLVAGKALPKISLVFANPHNAKLAFDTEVFTDPLA